MLQSQISWTTMSCNISLNTTVTAEDDNRKTSQSISHTSTMKINCHLSNQKWLLFLMQRIIICLKRSREGELFKLRSNENYEKICSSPCRLSNCETHILFSFYVTDHQEKTQRLEAIITQSQSQGQIGRQSAAMQLTVPEITRIDCCDTCQVSIFKTILQMWSC